MQCTLTSESGAENIENRTLLNAILEKEGTR